MKNICRHIALKGQRGSAAAQAALIIPLILVPLLAFVLLLGRYFWYFTVAQKAVHDTVLALATSSPADVRSNAASGLVRTILSMKVTDPFLSGITGAVLGTDGLIMTGVTVRYVGR
jgi:hypothetical protein